MNFLYLTLQFPHRMDPQLAQGQIFMLCVVVHRNNEKQKS